MKPDAPLPPDRRAPYLSRRGLVVLGAAAGVAGAMAAGHWFNIWAETGADSLSAPEAHRAALSGALLLFDIRRPDEWALTGVGEGARPLDMRRKDFIAALTAMVRGDTARPVALICARGVRSRRMAARLRAAGFLTVLDVPEGMLGSGAGPGWLSRGLPVGKEG